jgi:GntR family carbon starvation induced transcriptional regulator
MTLAESAYQDIRRDIVRGVFDPGQPLRMALLSERYKMGFSPLREALTRLQSERLVVSVALRGFSVAPLSIDEMWDAINTRIHIDTEALRLSMLHGDDAWEAGIVAAHHALKLQAERATSRDEPEQRMLEIRHYAFHCALLAACQSKWLLDFSQKLYADTERYRYPMLINRRRESGRDISSEHEQLMAATLARDARLALDLLRVHLKRTAQFLDEPKDLPQASHEPVLSLHQPKEFL